MNSWVHPELGEIVSIVPEQQPAKVWKHFYDPEEHWERLLEGTHVRQIAQEAYDLGCPTFSRWWKDASLPALEEPCLRAMQRHHDAYYAAAYWIDLVAEKTIWAPSLRHPHGWTFCSARGVILGLERLSRGWIRTAYRPQRSGLNVPMTERDFREQAKTLFNKITRKSEPSSWKAQVAADLASSSMVTPTTVNDVWWLALAIGHARSLEEPELQAARVKAETVLSTVAPLLLDQLRSALAFDELLDSLSTVLKTGRVDPAEQILLAIEDVLAIAPVVGAAAQAEPFAETVFGLLAWAPSSWTPLGRLAAARLAASGSAGLLYHFWTECEEAVVGAAVREAEPARLPSPTLLDELVPAPVNMDHVLLQRLAALGRRVRREVTSWAEELLAGCRLTPDPAMGLHEVERPWKLWSRVAPDRQGHRRLFVVDSEYPEGREVTEQLDAGDCSLWDFEKPGQEALLLLFVSESHLPATGTTLAEMLYYSEQTPEVTVVDRLVSRPR